jgi:FlaA1/EpsC-like NDP-sugar epimerase
MSERILDRILVTGAFGSLGSALIPELDRPGVIVAGVDMPHVDVRNANEVSFAISSFDPALIFHLAAMKHAPNGEADPAEFAAVNVGGTYNVLQAAGQVDARVILASSCKACDPETVYGASKLIAERMVLNAGGSVARFFNIPESSGNVFELWRNLPEDEPIPVTQCTRYFQSLEQAIGLLVALIDLPAGRYCVDPGEARWMDEVAHDLYPGRAQRHMSPRRGDRLHEPLHAEHEQIGFLAELGFLRVESAYDPVPTAEAVAA